LHEAASDNCGMGKPLALRAACLALFVALAAFAFAASAQTATDAADGWKLSVATGPAFALGKAAERWAKLVAERSGGKLSVRMYPGAALSSRDPAREFLALRDGAVDLAVGSTLHWSTQVVDLNLVGLPWLAPDDKAIDALATGVVGERLLAAVERAGAVPLALAVLGHHALATSASLQSPADLAGVRVRTFWTPLVVDLYVGLGALPRSLSATDAHAAFRAGTLNAQDGTLAAIAAARLETFGVKQVVVWGATAECAVFAANKGAWDAWTQEQRDTARESAIEAARELPALVRSEHDAAQNELSQHGVTVMRLTAAGRAAFAAAARSTYDKWAARIDPELLQAAEAAVTRTR
jgi:TRAP-type C4-dicarboxylate transport system substrate-binding protein